MSTYPAVLDSLPRPSAATTMDASGFEGDVIIDGLSDAIEATQGALGTNPQGAAVTVGARIAAVESGKEDAGVSAAGLAAHVAASDPHPVYTTAAEAAAAAPVQSVAGRTGAVTVTAADVGLGNVNNTSDANKPISTATQTALNGKEDTGVAASLDAAHNAAANAHGATTVGNSVLQAATKTAAAIAIGVLLSGSTTAKTGNFTVGTTERGFVYNWTVGASNATATFPTLAAGDDGFCFTIIKSDSSAGTGLTASGVADRFVVQGESATYRWDGASWTTVSRYAPDEADASAFGLMGDGDVTISSSITNTRDMHYRVLTLVAGAALNTGSYALIGETCDMSAAPAGAIVRNGSNGSSGSAGTAGTGGAGGTAGAVIAGKTLPGSNTPTVGGAGGTAAGVQAGSNTGTTNWGSNGGAGAAGGLGASGAGGAVRTASTPTVWGPWRSLYYLGAYGSGSVNSGSSGQSGSGGGGDTTNGGSGGGSSGKGGGFVFLMFRKFITSVSTAAAAIQAKGGNGGNGGTATLGNTGGGGSGAGAGGGCVVLGFYERIGSAVTGLIDVSGGNSGTGGNGVGTGVGGNAAQSGATGAVTWVNIKTGIWTDAQASGQTNYVNGGTASGNTGGTAATANSGTATV